MQESDISLWFICFDKKQWVELNPPFSYSYSSPLDPPHSSAQHSQDNHISEFGILKLGVLSVPGVLI